LLRKILLSHVVVRESPDANNNKTLIRIHLIPLSTAGVAGTSTSDINSVLYPQTVVKQKRNQHVSHLPTYRKITQDMLDVSCSSKRLSYNNCAICCSNFKEGEYYRKLPICEHVYHKKCIDKWFTRDKNHMKCPICRISHTKEKVDEFNASQPTNLNTNETSASYQFSRETSQSIEVVS